MLKIPQQFPHDNFLRHFYNALDKIFSTIYEGKYAVEAFFITNTSKEPSVTATTKFMLIKKQRKEGVFIG